MSFLLNHAPNLLKIHLWKTLIVMRIRTMKVNPMKTPKLWESNKEPKMGFRRLFQAKLLLVISLKASNFQLVRNLTWGVTKIIPQLNFNALRTISSVLLTTHFRLERKLHLVYKLSSAVRWIPNYGRKKKFLSGKLQLFLLERSSKNLNYTSWLSQFFLSSQWKLFSSLIRVRSLVIWIL